MPTNKLWLEHTERAAWDSVEALRERLLKAEGRLEALASGVRGLPQLLDLLDEAKQKFAPEAESHDQIVARLMARIERLQAEVDASKAAGPTLVSFVSAPPRLRLDSEELEGPRAAHRRNDDFDLGDFAQIMQRRGEGAEPARDLNRLLTLAENKLDDLSELEGGALREAAVELAILAGRIYAASRGAE